VRALAQRHDDRPLRLGYVTELYSYARGAEAGGGSSL